MAERLAVPERKVAIKYGGDVMNGSENIRNAAMYAARIYDERKYTPVFIVSAMRGTTPDLKGIVYSFGQGESRQELDRRLMLIQHRHFDVIDSLDLNGESKEAKKKVSQTIDSVQSYLSLASNISPELQAFICAAGERLAVPMLVAVMRELGLPAEYVDSRHVVTTSPHSLNGTILYEATKHKAKQTIVPMLMNGYYPVVTGYFGSSESESNTFDLSDIGKPGETNLVGDGGSDYITTGVANAVNARRALLIKGVMRGKIAGVFTDDPKTNANAELRRHMTFEETVGFSGQVLHERAVEPLIEGNIPAWVISLSAHEREPFDPAGTLLYTPRTNRQPVKNV